MTGADAAAMGGHDIGIEIINIVLLATLFVTAVAIARLRSLFAIVMLSGIYSLVSATWFVVLDAVDVAFTEAAVGAGMTTVVMLAAMLLTARTAKPYKPGVRTAPFFVVLATGAVLIYATFDLPPLGAADSPVNSGVGLDYLRIDYFDSGIPNVVTTVLASYRGFDTLGETAVVFVAGIAVALLLGFGERSLADSIPGDGAKSARTGAARGVDDRDHHVILRVIAKMLIPVIALFAFYVQFHGDYGPGGGFQAGVIVAVAVILHALVFGVPAAMRAVPPAFTRSLAAFGVLLYSGVGFWALLKGGNFLEYQALFGEPPGGHEGQHIGILVIELGVLFGVSGAMLTIFYAFAGRVAEIRDEDW